MPGQSHFLVAFEDAGFFPLPVPFFDGGAFVFFVFAFADTNKAFNPAALIEIKG